MRVSAILRLAAASAWSRRGVLALCLASIVLASALLLGVAQVRQDLRERYAASISGTDLVVGPRGSALALVLHAVFHLGESQQNMSWQSAQWLANHPAVRWTLPVSLGDTHRGFPVLATDMRYFTLFRYGNDEPLRFARGSAPASLFEVALGSEVARRLGYQVGTRIVLQHGSEAIDGTEHDDKPLTVSGVLTPTGTPTDRSLFIRLDTMQALHLDWQGGAPLSGPAGLRIPAELTRKFDLTPREVTAVLVGLKSRAQAFAMQREIAAYKGEALMAALPGIALDELWALADQGERALLLVLAAVAVVSVAGLVACLLAGLAARRRELAILRALGASPRSLIALLLLEGALVALLGVAGGWLVLGGFWHLAGGWLLTQYGVAPAAFALGPQQLQLAALLLCGALAACLVPALQAYRIALADGLNPRL